MKTEYLQTFDFYDTLITRLVGVPADIFSLVGEELSLTDFRELRMAAEERAKILYGDEVTYDQIYGCLPLSENVRAEASRLETYYESELIVPIRCISSMFHNGDIVISDMYHKQEFFQGILSRVLPGKNPERIYVSGTEGISKANGLLWEKVAAEYPHHKRHVGDNYHSDVRQATRHGFQATHFTNAQLNRYEKAMANEGLDGSLLAGVCRASRLNLIKSDADGIDAAAITAFTSVFAPLLYAFSEWVIEQCSKQNIKRAYFLARDGILPFRICKALCEARGVALDCSYIFGSRHALHLPGFTDIALAEDWLLDNREDLSLRTIARRGAIPLAVVQGAASKFIATDPDRKIPPTEYHILQSIIRNSSVEDAIRQSSDDAFRTAISYYRSVGLTKPAPAALIDIGWNGRMQRSLRTLLSKSGDGPELIAGMYLCLSRRNRSDSRDTYHGFLFEQPDERDIRPIYDGYRAVLEAALTSDHATTVGFEADGSETRPVFGWPSDEPLQRRIRLQHAVVEEFTSNAIKLERVANHPIRVPFNVIEKNLLAFLKYPTRQDGIAFSNFYLSGGQTEGSHEAICLKMKPQNLRHTAKPLGWWPEGTIAASGYEALCYPLQGLRKLKRSLGL